MSAMNAGTKSVSADGKTCTTGSSLDAGFALLRGEINSHVMQDYEIIVGHNTRELKVDFDLTTIGGSRKHISPHHARIFFDFKNHHFSLQVLSMKGCTVQGVFSLPGKDPIELKSQDLIEIGDAKFYFLLPSRSLSDSISAWRTETLSQPLSSSSLPPSYPFSINFRGSSCVIGSPSDDAGHTQIPSHPVHSHLSDLRGTSCGHGWVNGDHGVTIGTETQGTSMGQSKRSSDELDTNCGPINVDPLGEHAKKVVREADKDTDNEQLCVTNEKDLISYVIILVANNCKHGEWMPMKNLHAKLVEHFSTIWPRWKVQKYLAPEDGSSAGTLGKPWQNLLELLLKHPEHFVTNTICRGTTTSEFVSLASLVDTVFLT